MFDKMSKTMLPNLTDQQFWQNSPSTTRYAFSKNRRPKINLSGLRKTIPDLIFKIIVNKEIGDFEARVIWVFSLTHLNGTCLSLEWYDLAKWRLVSWEKLNSLMALYHWRCLRSRKGSKCHIVLLWSICYHIYFVVCVYFYFEYLIFYEYKRSLLNISFNKRYFSHDDVVLLDF